MILPKGYLDAGRAEYLALDVPTLRAVYVKLHDIVAYTVGSDETDRMIREDVADDPSPVDWIMAVKGIKVCCERCRGTGTYSWGACINGRMSHSGPCARCGGNGQMTFDDMRRGRAYDNHAIQRACSV